MPGSYIRGVLLPRRRTFGGYYVYRFLRPGVTVLCPGILTSRGSSVLGFLSGVLN